MTLFQPAQGTLIKHPVHARAPAFDAAAINETIRRALASAGLDTTSGPMHDVTETIRRALASGGMASAPGAPETGASVVDVVARVVDPDPHPEVVADRRPSAGAGAPPGRFETHHFSNPAGARAYKVYVPAGVAAASPPVIVMLHGCTQSADDFAAGTQMNRLADAQGFLVVYPEQPAGANPSKCWNWFKAQDQLRDAGEPSLVAGIVGDVLRRHGADPRRVFVAGLSAGAALAVIMGETYPELFAGVGVHSGLPYGSAHDIPTAMAAMKGGRSGLPGLQRTPGAAAAPRRKASRAVPTIVFHGDRDHTVHASNGAEIVQQARAAHLADAADAGLRTHTHRGSAAGGKGYSRTVHADASGASRIESWTVHGAGHAWSGGHASGSYTDGSGPDASAEMVRFFLALPSGASA